MIYDHLVGQLAPPGLAYLHMIQGETGGSRAPEDAAQPFDYDALHQRFSGCWMINNGYDRADAEQALSSGKADLVAFGRLFINNSDLVRRLPEAAPLTPLQEEKLYGGGAEGYTDYPTLDATG